MWMIRESLTQTKRATYSILTPNPDLSGMPTPQGTGFFINGSGLFLTALHVVENVNMPEIWLMQRYILADPPGILQRPEMVQSWPEHDMAALKLDFESNAAAPQLNGLNGFPYITVDLESQEDGTPIYSFGYPLPEVQEETIPDGLAVVHPGLGPRTTSAIIASSIEHTRSVIQNPVSGTVLRVTAQMRKSCDTPQSVIKEQRLSWKNLRVPVKEFSAAPENRCATIVPLA
jgi:serine protease Do